MKNFILPFIIFISFSGFSQDNNNALLWEITGNGLENPSYIFGTIHMISSKDYFFEDIWLEKLNNCETLVLETEVDFGLFQQLGMIKKIMLPDKKTIQEYMPTEKFTEYKSYMIDTLNFSESEFEIYSKMKPFYVYSMILTKLIGTDLEFYEMNLSEIAKKNKMDIIGLETTEFQMSIVDSIPIETQIEMFIYNENSSKDDIINEFNEMVKTYKQQNINKLQEQTSESDEMNDLEASLLINRNLRWVVDIQTIINHNPSFIAVGAAHLGGKQGVLQLLKNYGYDVNPVN